MSRGGATQTWRDQGTRSRDRLLSHLRAYMNEHGYSPTVRELTTLMDYSSTSATQHHLNVLRQEGKITFLPHVARTIRIVEAKDDSDISRACD